jgi:hypothetical protein
MIETAGDLITFALRTAGINGIGQTPTAEDSNTGLQLLSNIMAEWQRKRWLVWDLVETVLVSTGAQTYTLGPSGDFPMARPDRIDAAFVRLLNPAGGNQTDYPLTVIEAREDYNRIALKTMNSWPDAVFYESAWPVGVAHFWPVPFAGQYEMHIFTKAPLPVYTGLATPLNLPPEYMSAITYNLAAELSMNYGEDPRPAVIGKLRAALNTIRQANSQVPRLQMPPGLGGPRNISSMVGNGIGRAFILDQGTVL